MNVCILQPLFPKEAAEASGFIDWILGELDRCDDTLDLIVLPEYSNAPSVYPNPDDYLADLEAFSEPLLRKVRDTCRRCGAIAAVNIARPFEGSLFQAAPFPDRTGKKVGGCRLYPEGEGTHHGRSGGDPLRLPDLL